MGVHGQLAQKGKISLPRQLRAGMVDTILLHLIVDVIALQHWAGCIYLDLGIHHHLSVQHVLIVAYIFRISRPGFVLFYPGHSDD